MASRYQIQMDFNKAGQKANDLDDIADRLSRIADTDLQNVLNSLGSDWKGDNAGAYIQKSQGVREHMQETVKDLRNTATTIRTIAKNIYDAEMEAVRIAEEREAAARRAAEDAARRAAEEAARNVGGTFSSPGSSGSGHSSGGGRRF
ncbi:MAG: WXG100 family type VII secretion target [Lachnospiraceae bacterium]|nr:WXG100 family type VII secretion target [Lachnospiraceae bacterium]